MELFTNKFVSWFIVLYSHKPKVVCWGIHIIISSLLTHRKIPSAYSDQPTVCMHLYVGLHVCVCMYVHVHVSGPVRVCAFRAMPSCLPSLIHSITWSWDPQLSPVFHRSTEQGDRVQQGKWRKKGRNHRRKDADWGEIGGGGSWESCFSVIRPCIEQLNTSFGMCACLCRCVDAHTKEWH